MLIDRSELLSCLAEDLGVSEREPSDIVAACASAFTLAMSNPTIENINRYDRLNQAKAIFHKAVPVKGSDDDDVLSSLALSHFLEVEEEVGSFPPIWRFDPVFLESVRFLIARVLGDAKQISRIFADCSFGPGVTAHTKGPTGRHLLTKIGGVQSCTRQCGEFAVFAVQAVYPHWYGELRNLPCKVIPGNRVEFVPKDRRKHRQIAIEPSLNMFLQLGIGNYLIKRLRLFGVNLTDQSRNRELARIGSTTGAYATIDLSDASNRISYGLVKDLLPPEWFDLLDRLRSPVGILPNGQEHVHQAFSTQGNGYTFPLESLIFWAITRVACHGLVSVYGDDIVVLSGQYRSATSALELCGFVVNHEKSFSDGPFRESCGADYILGHYVRPVYYKDDAHTEGDVISLHNRLWARWPTIRRTREYLLSCVKDPVFGPATVVSDRSTPGVNSEAVYEREGFWPGSPTQLEFNARTGAFYYTVTRVQEIPIAPRGVKRSRLSQYSRYLCFLYGGSRSLMISSMTKEVRRRSRIFHECVTSWYRIHPDL